MRLQYPLRYVKGHKQRGGYEQGAQLSIMHFFFEDDTAEPDFFHKWRDEDEMTPNDAFGGPDGKV